MTGEKPYTWTKARPQEVIGRKALLDEVETGLLGDESFALLGGRGMGKTVFLTELVRRLEVRQNVQIELIDELPGERTKSACVAMLADTLGVGEQRSGTVKAVLRAWQTAHPGKKLILLYDDVDDYATERGKRSELGRDFFSALESARQHLDIGVLAAGSLGMFFLGSETMGSSFLSRATTHVLAPFGREELLAWTTPFAAVGGLDDEVVDGLLCFCGGNPAITAFCLEGLWASSPPALEVVVDRIKCFRGRHVSFISAFQRGLGEGTGLSGVWGLFDHIRQHEGPYTKKELEDVLRDAGGEGDLKLEQAFQVLCGAGACRIHSPHEPQYPVDIEVVSSILAMRSGEERGAVAVSLSELLRGDIVWALAQLHRWGRDFFRPVDERAVDASNVTVKKKVKGASVVVPESVFSALLGITLLARGWEWIEREPLQGAGFADLKLRHRNFGGHALIEVKIWPRNDFTAIHDQVCSYDADDAVAWATVMVFAGKVNNWPACYKEKCLAGATSVEELPIPPSDFVVGFAAKGGARPGLVVEHFLVALPEPRKRGR